MLKNNFTRRSFITSTSTALSATAWSKVFGANSRLRIAAIGVGGKGFSDLQNTAASPHAEIVALCDIDENTKHLGRAAKLYPHATTFNDWRRLLDHSQSFDACIISTPDHMHAPIALPAMKLGKHVQCQKPLTHTVFEARQMQKVAKASGVITQMGNQIQSHTAYQTAVKLVHDGHIGKVSEVHAWQSGDMRWLKTNTPPPATTIPSGVHWDQWLGVAPDRLYAPDVYHPFSWRAWQDFSNGQLGDFGCHILDPVFMSLELSAPITIQATSPMLNNEVWGPRCTVRYEFPPTRRTTSHSIPVVWHDGKGHKPDLLELGLNKSVQLPQAGSIMIGEKAALLLPHVGMPSILTPSEIIECPIEPLPERNHYTSWVDACRGTDTTTSHFDYAGPLTETVLLGTVAIRCNNTRLTWNPNAMKITGSPHAEALLSKEYRHGWEPHWL